MNHPLPPEQRGPIRRRRLHRATFAAAGLYNLAWAAYSVWDPQWFMRMAGLPLANHPQIFACLAMVVGVYGFLYLEVARVPEHGFALAGVGLLGKVAGPLGMAYLIVTDVWPPAALWLCVTNDLVWWVPFGLYAWDAWPYYRDDLRGASTPLPPDAQGRAVYRPLLGPHLDELPAPLRALHGRRQVTAVGRFDLGRERGLWPWFLAFTSPLPTHGGQLDMEVSITTSGPYQIWTRRLAGKPMTSAQHGRADGCVAERFGPLEVRLTLDVVDGGIQHESAGFFLCLGPVRIPLPTRLCPRIRARVVAEGDHGVHTHVEMLNSKGRRVMWYGGVVEVVDARLTP